MIRWSLSNFKIIFNSNLGESSSDPERLSHKLMSILEPSSPIHDRKVKFNEMVERIEVINDHDPDADDIPHHMRYWFKSVN